MTDIVVPTLGESVTEATVGKWLKTAGATEVTPVSMPANNLAFVATKGPG